MPAHKTRNEPIDRPQANRLLELLAEKKADPAEVVAQSILTFMELLAVAEPTQEDSRLCTIAAKSLATCAGLYRVMPELIGEVFQIPSASFMATKTDRQKDSVPPGFPKAVVHNSQPPRAPRPADEN